MSLRTTLLVCRIVTGGPLDERHDLPHPDAAVEEWVFTCWLPDASAGLVTGYRRHVGGFGWYWAALARRGEPLLHVTEWEVPSRHDPLLAKAHGLWAEHVCETPMQQWTVANETYATALDDPEDALGRAFGMPSALAVDLEWYATAAPVPGDDGFRQDGVGHGVIELAGGPLHLPRLRLAAGAAGDSDSGRCRCRRPTPTPASGRRSPSRTRRSPTGC